jgi:hypothetical protein
MAKIVITEVKISLPEGFKPATHTYRAISQIKAKADAEFVAQSAEKLFVDDVLIKAGLEECDLKVRVQQSTLYIHAYIPTKEQKTKKGQEDGKAD